MNGIYCSCSTPGHLCKLHVGSCSVFSVRTSVIISFIAFNLFEPFSCALRIIRDGPRWCSRIVLLRCYEWMMINWNDFLFLCHETTKFNSLHWNTSNYYCEASKAGIFACALISIECIWWGANRGQGHAIAEKSAVNNIQFSFNWISYSIASPTFYSIWLRVFFCETFAPRTCYWRITVTLTLFIFIRFCGIRLDSNTSGQLARRVIEFQFVLHFVEIESMTRTRVACVEAVDLRHCQNKHEGFASHCLRALDVGCCHSIEWTHFNLFFSIVISLFNNVRSEKTNKPIECGCDFFSG